MAEPNVIFNLGQAAAYDAVDQFGNRANSFFNLVDEFNKHPLAIGTVINQYKADKVTLADGNVEPGAIIPLSNVEAEVVSTKKLDFKKYRALVPGEAVQQFGYERAFNKTLGSLVSKVQKEIRQGMLDSLAAGTGTRTGESFQQLLARNTAAVKIAFGDDDPQAVSFVNTNDAYEYLGAADITVQTLFGLDYIENFMGNKLVFLSGDIPEGTVYTTAVGNLNLYYADVSGQLSNMDTVFATDESGIIGVTVGYNRERFGEEAVVVHAVEWLPERLDGVVVGTITP